MTTTKSLVINKLECARNKIQSEIIELKNLKYKNLMIMILIVIY
jgi:hypothetical protein